MTRLHLCLKRLLRASVGRASLLALLLQTGLVYAATLCPAGGPIRFAHYEFGLLYSHQTGRGVDADLVAELQRRSGCRFEITLQPRARTWADLQSGHIDMAGSGIQTPARDTFAWFAHYVVEDNRVLLGSRVPRSVRSLADFEAYPGLRIGAVRSFSHSPNYDAAIARLRLAGRVIEVSDTPSLYRLFKLGSIDSFVASPFLTGYYLKRYGMPVPQRIEDWDPDPPTPSGLVLAKHRFSAEQARAWQGMVQSLLKDGTVSRILERHLGPASAPAALYTGS
jgi:polar amino acid transport system substrate-binding protein